MLIDVIVPSNNEEEINGFIKSFSSMKKFSSICRLVIIGNGEVYQKSIEFTNSLRIKFKRINTDYSDKLISFSKLRGTGMKDSNADFFLFMDDDNRFPKGCDKFFLKCSDFLFNSVDCGTLQADRRRPYKKGTEHQLNGFFWSGYGLFIKNTFDITKGFLSFDGCCEETLFAYESLDKFGLPYKIYGNPTYRDTSKEANWNQNNHPSYSEEVIQKNIQGYIQKKYHDKEWRYYEEIPNGKFPKDLQDKIDKRMNNEK